MTTAIIVTLCILILTAYLFDLSSSRTRIPSVILLLALGWFLKKATVYLNIAIPDLSNVLPVLGTVGLILIVLEGSLELELNRSKSLLIKKSIAGALLPLLILSFGIAFFFQYYGQTDFRRCLINAIPLAVISSAIAIPSASRLSGARKEFVIYESSLSDIFGVLLFNFVALNESFGWITFTDFSLQILLIILISFVATLGLAFLLSRIEHHIKFVPIILLIILIYVLSKEYHLPALIFILIFGLFLGNIDKLRKYQWAEKFSPGELQSEVHKLKQLNIEGAFLIRSLFFLVFGFMIDTKELLNTDTLLWSVSITIAIFLLRLIQMLASRLPVFPLLFIAPRGLITILLFISIAPADLLPFMNKSIIIQVIILSAMFMMLGLMIGGSGRKQEAVSEEVRP